MSMKRDDVNRVICFHGLSLSCLVLKAVESAKKYVTRCDQQWSQFSVVEKGTEALMTVASSAAVCDKGFIPVWPASIRNFTMFFSLRGQLFSILEWRWQVVRGRVPWRLKVRSIHCTSIVTLWWTSIMLYYELLQELQSCHQQHREWCVQRLGQQVSSSRSSLLIWAKAKFQLMHYKHKKLHNLIKMMFVENCLHTFTLYV